TMDGVAFIQIQNILSEKGKELSAGWFIQMPNNDIPVDDLNSQEEMDQKLKQAKPQIKEMAECIKESKANEIEIPTKRTRSIEKTNKTFRDGVFKMDEFFFADENCTSCGICEQVCPINNIILVDGKPQWQHECQMCVACINYCPEESIQYDEKTQDRGRYQNPEITVEEIISQKK
ncbi:MAG: hypothetical protein EU542_07365, partial [Promethearchaeota archaeon]